MPASNAYLELLSSIGFDLREWSTYDVALTDNKGYSWVATKYQYQQNGEQTAARTFGSMPQIKRFFIKNKIPLQTQLPPPPQKKRRRESFKARQASSIEKRESSSSSTSNQLGTSSSVMADQSDEAAAAAVLLSGFIQSTTCDLDASSITNTFATKKKRKKSTDQCTYLCHLCEYETDYSSHLLRHIWTHSGYKPHVCPHCDFSCKQRSNLDRHIRDKHVGEKPYKCTECVKAFKTSSHLCKHMRTHKGVEYVRVRARVVDRLAQIAKTTGKLN